MSVIPEATGAGPVTKAATPAAFSVVLALSICHFLNDTMQSVISAIYPILKLNYALTLHRSVC
jgi:FSR family fosmidomycin resistance protein-like MFS transporter